MDITIEYTLTPDDIVPLMRVTSSRPKPRWKFALALLMPAIVLGALAFGSFHLFFASIPLLLAPASRGYALIAMLPGVAILALVLLFLLRKPLLRAYLRRQLSRLPDVARLQVLHLTDAGIEFRNGDAASSLGWHQYVQFEELPEIFLLYITRAKMLTIPKRAFPSPEAMQEFRAFAQAHIGNQPIGFPVQPPVAN